jgi:hypothetical protein
LYERLRFRDANDQGKQPFLERNRLTRSATFRAINNAPLRTSTFSVSLNRGRRKPGPDEFHQPTNNNRGDKMETRMPLGQRIARFLETRYVHRAHPHYLPEFAGFGIILILAVWPMLSMVAAALEKMR